MLGKKRGKLNILVSGTMHGEVDKSRTSEKNLARYGSITRKGVFIAVDMVM